MGCSHSELFLSVGLRREVGNDCSCSHVLGRLDNELPPDSSLRVNHGFEHRGCGRIANVEAGDGRLGSTGRC